MTNSRFYTATKEDSRPWNSTENARTSTADESSQATADALQVSARATFPTTVTSIVPDTTTVTATAATGSTHTHQIVVTGKEGTVVSAQGIVASFASSNTAKATVDASGLVTAVAAGTATVTVTAVANTSLTTAVTVTVS